MTARRQPRKAGARWRLLAWTDTQRIDIRHDQHPGAIFDELVVDHWLHVEQMDTGTWWMRVGNQTFLVHVDRDGRLRYLEDGS